MFFFRFRLAVKKQFRLAEMVEEAFTSFPYFPGIDPFCIRGKASLQFTSLEWTTAANGIRMITCSAGIDLLPHRSIALVIVYRHYRPIDRYFMEIGSAQADKLCVGIGEQTSL
jgi:hypothetical protein